MEVLSSNQSLVYKEISYLNSDGIKENSLIIDKPILKRFYDIGVYLSFSLAFAIFISTFISSKLKEEQLKSKKAELESLKDNLYKDIHNALFQKIIPKELFQTVKDEIINAEIIRKDAEWILDFSVDDNENITCRLTSIMKSYNNTNQIIKNPISAVIANHNPSDTSIEKVICSIKGKQTVYYEKNNKPEENKGVEIEKIDDKMHKIHYDLEIPPNNYVDYTIIYKIEHSKRLQDEFFTWLPVINLKIIATYPPEYNFEIFSMLSPSLELKVKDDDRSIYEAEGGILPRQGIVYYLDKKTTHNNV